MFKKLALISLLALFTTAAFADGTRAVLQSKEPLYPELAKRMNLKGSVTVTAVVGTDGKVKAVSGSNGNPILSQAAQAAVKQWIYASGPEETISVVVTFR